MSFIFNEEVVYLLIPTSNHNFDLTLEKNPRVVYLLIPTSNHNGDGAIQGQDLLFISWFLHQTTTDKCVIELKCGCLSLDSYIKPQLCSSTCWHAFRCLSLDSYIKPQPRNDVMARMDGCLSLDSYIKPQLWGGVPCTFEVVYLLIPTSNHNSYPAYKAFELVVYLLIPTSNHNWRYPGYVGRYVVYLLIPTSNHNRPNAWPYPSPLFISWFLHQTTTRWRAASPTPQLFISWFLHQTTTSEQRELRLLQLFISWFLHQTTTCRDAMRPWSRCLSLDSYIKPQPSSNRRRSENVVYLLIPTSNHNVGCGHCDACRVVYLLIPTSNHNLPSFLRKKEVLFISWFLHQTTTAAASVIGSGMLFISWFLHQTTT